MEALKETQLYCPFAYIDGSWVAADSGEQITVLNPATGEAIGDIPRLGKAETERAIDAADAALPAWRALTAQERADLLLKWHDLMLEHQQDLAMLMTYEQGKPLKEAAGEIAYAASFLRWFAEEARRVYGETIPAANANQRIVVTKQPVGVVGAITPWNFPAAMITRKAGAALAAGCTIVVKPASQTPFSATALALLAERAGIPRGVFNVVPGSASDIAQAMTQSPKVRKITFTGSTEVGRKLMAQAAEHIQKISLELGGNAPFIVFEDADLDAAVEGAMAAKFRNAGQTCICTNRFLVQSSVINAFCEKLAVAMNSELHVGDGTKPNINIGPLIDDNAVKKVSEHVQDAIDNGAELLLGGHPHPLGGNFFTPTLISFATDKMKVAHEETFGPLAAVFPFDDEETAIEMANDTQYGLASYFYSRDLARVWRVSEALEYGMVGINTGAISNAAAPFGGVKASGLGREGGHQGLEEYLETKYLCIDLG
ncbi:NAD-dependent succinate-semialdehyde dehydrogenase [Halomonas sp. FeN2]|jgi:succinate-semialdehyde dehydrogenase / glutarate-semialdehyde dehydrogenase|uniref:NAD-dependent succinate-semialdehyde dehydrogenase n=1 Tax=Vreelandella neptunia TaxID=115551 RepID=A0ABZ0YSB1_9GAMM|nr:MULTISPECIES: NAD-dependent succinate-semialdehyde dehydrogenase [Halomonas]TDV99523.1 succinate-semialdehyde dehydrogenase/glutarate-semialdehyde dehydrogenase [Halomonas alkaliantarctica]MBF59755.1 succinate-semialdehyde dehydrogenase (NADP(+)) [Halomonas sp.]MBL1268196.1 NAD-dependent succinate-semialdehyde dehydrogenase [Halomonas sp.]MDN3561493.1 NAD-dependent succinate-semialdehyde dehydrogenase [Halomonas neptunia]UBR49836.1 NAD-dependent succinate-semialdehyde dehydrogenase [Halomon|tara:strand:- start:553 stop:2010 length:1458 start_codon:yes stop_codon:yes gene_type:complete